VTRSLIVGFALVACQSSPSPDPLLRFDEANLAAWRALCGDALEQKSGPVSVLAEDGLADRGFNNVEVVMWTCITPDWSVLFLAETKEGLVDNIKVGARPGMDPAVFVDQLEKLVLPLVRPELRSERQAFFRKPMDGSGCVDERSGDLKLAGCWGPKYKDEPFLWWVRLGRLDKND